jgi:hypothetical protein
MDRWTTLKLFLEEERIGQWIATRFSSKEDAVFMVVGGWNPSSSRAQVSKFEGSTLCLFLQNE